ncbi:MAG: ATP-dependent zinc metalloprotease FtsH [Acidimicrobiia bacterium]|nr:ATP-dependent zinc metalloprotease FtsH [Acidimicrobiia bacterium]MDH5293149.1 ATP-dependent zinc metalloprotease FtsH [Acidimicrobiia bacterium]
MAWVGACPHRPRDDDNQRTILNRTFRTLLIYGLVFVVLAVVAQQWFDQLSAPAEISLSEYYERLDEGSIDSVVILERSDRIQGRELESTAPEGSFDFFLQYPPEYEDDVTQRSIDAGIQVENDVEPPSFFEILIGFLPWLFLIGFMVFIFMQMQGSGNRVMQFGKAKAKTITKDQPKVTFKDVAGIDEAIEELEEIKDFLAHPDKYRALGAKIPKGVLLYGPPGTGKTLLARAIAGEAGVPFLSISGSDFVEMFVGVGASRVRDLFDQAKQTAPAIVFIDEIDAVGRHRGAGLGGGHDEREQTLNQLLVELDGFEGNTGVIVMAATNRPDILDPALLRPGRFDRQIIIDAPDIRGREGILNVHARGKPFDSDVELAVLARRTPGFTGADLANLINEAALLTARRRKAKIGMDELEEAIDRVMAGPERKTRVMSEEEKRLTAFHEGGHALVGYALPHLDPIHKVTIIPRGRAGGYTLALPTEDRYYKRRSEMVDELAYALGGRTAEEIVFGDPSTGASNDIEKATQLARRMVMEFGMSDRLGPMKYGHANGEVFLGRDYTRQADYSDEVAAWIDEEVRALINAAHEEAREILNTHVDALHRLADELMDRETLDRDEVAEVFHDVPKWEHANGGALRIRRPPAPERGSSGIAAAQQSEPTRSR